MIFLDANVVLEILLSGRLRQSQVEKWLRSNDKPLCISTLTVHLVLHFGQLSGLRKSELEASLEGYVMESLTADDYKEAMRLVKGRDYEDALQLAVAMRCGCEKIVTLDKDFAKFYADIIPFETIN